MGIGGYFLTSFSLNTGKTPVISCPFGFVPGKDFATPIPFETFLYPVLLP
jgi:hypothetical protein